MVLSTLIKEDSLYNEGLLQDTERNGHLGKGQQERYLHHIIQGSGNITILPKLREHHRRNRKKVRARRLGKGGKILSSTHDSHGNQDLTGTAIVYTEPV